MFVKLQLKHSCELFFYYVYEIENWKKTEATKSFIGTILTKL